MALTEADVSAQVARADRAEADPPVSGVLSVIVLVLGMAFTAFELYVAALGGAFTPLVVRAVHVGFVLALVFLTIDVRGRRRLGAHAGSTSLLALDALLALASAATCGYAIAHSERFLTVLAAFPSRTTMLDLTAAGILLLLILESARRLTTLSFSLITVAALLYAMFGDYTPDAIAINPNTLGEILTQLYTSTVGFWGEITGVSAVEIGVLVMFAGMLTGVGGLDTLRNLAVVVAGRTTGGAGKVAVIMSALFGMISGSSAANVASVGSFTIPMMTRSGFRRDFAAGLEAAGSTFGQLMPPIMGTGAFVMAELLNVSYARIMLAALLPSLAIYAAIYFATHFYAKREGVGALPGNIVAEARRNLTRAGAVQLGGPLAVLIGLMVYGQSVPSAAFWAYVATVAIFVAQRLRHPLRETIAALRNGVMAGVNSLLAIAVLIIAAQVLVTLLNMTALGVTFTTLVIGSTLQPFVLVLLTAVATLILGMGLPTTAAYVIAASVTVPIMTAVGFAPLAAHMFVFFFAILSAITPPVAVAVYVAAAIAEADWMKVSYECLRISLMKYVLPFVMLYNSALLFDGSVAAVVVVFVGVIVLAVVLEALCFRYMFVPMTAVQTALGAAGCIAICAALVTWGRADPVTWTFLAAAGMLLSAATAFLNRRVGRIRGELTTP